MPLSDADIVQFNTGGFNAASGAATLAATTAGNAVVLVATPLAVLIASPPTGFTLVVSHTAGTRGRTYLYVKPNVGAGETSWTITPSTSGAVAWSVFEVQNLDLLTPTDVTASAITTSGTTIGSGTTATSTTYDGMVLAVHTHNNTTTSPAPTFTAHTDSMTELTESSQASATQVVGHSVSVKFTQSLGTFTCSASSSLTTDASNAGSGVVAVLSSESAKRVVAIDQMWGAEQQTVAGLATGAAGNRIFETVTGTPTINTTTPRSGAACYELSGTASAQNMQGVQLGLTGAQRPVLRVCFHVPTSLPGGDVEVFSEILPGASAFVRFRSASGKLGLQLGVATEVLSDQAITADTWVCVDLLVYGDATSWTGAWTVDYGDGVGVAQTSATRTPAATLTAATPVLGWTAAATATIRYDDVVMSKVKGHYPLGDHRIYLLKPDPAGTLTISGTSTNFLLMTANATGAAWNAATALSNITEGPPPTIGASAAGFLQAAIAASDYVNIPMETYDAAGTAGIRAVRMIACGWAASATAATIGFRGFDGTTETTLFTPADPEFDNSTTLPAWMCKMYRPTGGWTQARLDALAFRVGLSEDATPDIGIHWIGAEVAVQVADVVPIIGEAGAPTAEINLDPVTAGTLAVTIDTPADQGATLNWDDGTPGSQAIAAGASHTEPFDAVDASTVTYVEVVSDADAPERG